MPNYLSEAWVAALNHAADGHPGLARVSAGIHLIIEQVVTEDTTSPPAASSPAAGDARGDGPPATADVVARWHVIVADGSVRFVYGPAADPTVRFTADATTARAITTGQLSATEAFMSGRFRVGGDTTSLVEHHALLDGLGDIFTAVQID